MLLGLAIHIRLTRWWPSRQRHRAGADYGGASAKAVSTFIKCVVTLVLAFAATYQLGGPADVMQLLAKESSPAEHVSALRAEKTVFRYGVSAVGACCPP